ncbi:MAG: hypothetical protein E7226_03050 [Clostridiales bacterium]|nr:hypothetical protein [Clostridiales bacterium]
MTKKVMLLVALVIAFSMTLTACGDSEAAAPSEINTATATMTEGEMPIEVTVDVSTGLSVAFDDDGFLLFDGEYDDSTYPLVTATILTDEVYEKYLADNKDSDTFREDDGFYKYTSDIGEACCLWKIGDKVPFMMSFEKSVDGDRADEIVGCLEFDY